MAYYREFHSLLFNEAIWTNIEKKMLGHQAFLSRAIVPTVLSGANTIPDNMDPICSVQGRAMDQQLNISVRLHMNQCLTLTDRLTNH